MEICTHTRRNFETDEILGYEFFATGALLKVLATDKSLIEIGGWRSVLECDNLNDLDTLRSFFLAHYFDLISQGFDKDKLHFNLELINSLTTTRKNELLSEQEEPEEPKW